MQPGVEVEKDPGGQAARVELLEGVQEGVGLREGLRVGEESEEGVALELTRSIPMLNAVTTVLHCAAPWLEVKRMGVAPEPEEWRTSERELVRPLIGPFGVVSRRTKDAVLCAGLKLTLAAIEY